MRRWRYNCPCCNKRITVNMPKVEISKSCVGATTNCSYCGNMLLIKKDLKVVDFGKYLDEVYAEARAAVSVTRAHGSVG